jgi:hypothetical protein
MGVLMKNYDFKPLDEFELLDFNTLLNKVNKNPKLLDKTFVYLILNTNSSNFMYLKGSKVYNEIVNRIINCDSTLLKIHFIIYVEPDMLGMLYENMNSLVDALVYSEYDRELKVQYLVRILDRVDDILLEKHIMNSISRLYDPDYDYYAYNNCLNQYKKIK